MQSLLYQEHSRLRQGLAAFGELAVHTGMYLGQC